MYFIKFSYKIIKFYLLIVYSEGIQRFKDACSRRKHEPNTYFVFGNPGPQTFDFFMEENSKKFFYHQFNDTLSTLAIILLLVVNIMFPLPFFRPTDPEKTIILIAVFVGEITLDILFSFVVYCAISSKFDGFRPIKCGAGSLYNCRFFAFWAIAVSYPLVSTIVNVTTILVYAKI